MLGYIISEGPLSLVQQLGLTISLNLNLPELLVVCLKLYEILLVSLSLFHLVVHDHVCLPQILDNVKPVLVA